MNHAEEAERVGVLRTGLGQKVCVLCVVCCVCVFGCPLFLKNKKLLAAPPPLGPPAIFSDNIVYIIYNYFNSIPNQLKKFLAQQVVPKY